MAEVMSSNTQWAYHTIPGPGQNYTRQGVPYQVQARTIIPGRVHLLFAPVGSRLRLGMGNNLILWHNIKISRLYYDTIQFIQFCKREILEHFYRYTYLLVTQDIIYKTLPDISGDSISKM